MTLQAKANRTNESKKIYLVQGNCPRISSVSDKNNWKAVMKALPVIGFTEEEVQVIFRNLTSATLQAVVISHCSCLFHLNHLLFSPPPELAQHRGQHPPSWKHSVWRRRGGRNLYHHRASDQQSCEGQNSPACISGCTNMHQILGGGAAKNRCVVVFQLLAVDGSALGEALTHKKLTAKGEEVIYK